jgi:hypothetical protein
VLSRHLRTMYISPIIKTLTISMILIFHGNITQTNDPLNAVGMPQGNSQFVQTSEMKEFKSSIGLCDLNIISFDKGDYRIDTSSGDCDPLSEPIWSETSRGLKGLLEREGVKPLKIHLLLYLPGHSSLIKLWASKLKQSKEWKSRARRQNQSEFYALVRKLMIKYKLFSKYEELLNNLGYNYKSLSIEKVDTPRARDFSVYSTDLKIIGYHEEEQIPLPLSTVVVFEKKAK